MSDSAPPIPSTSGQKLAVRQLKDIEAASKGSFEVLSAEPSTKSDNLIVKISLNVGTPFRAPNGLRLRPREKFNLHVPNNFPYALPTVTVSHTRFAGYAHVFWGICLCLYQAPQTEYDPSEGMYGIMRRLLKWLSEASADNLDPPQQPLHPPSAPADYSLPFRLVTQADAPQFTGDHWCGFARLAKITEHRFDVVGWMSFEEALDANSSQDILFPAVLTKGGMPHEFPAKADAIIDHLTRLGCSRERLLLILRFCTLFTPKERPICLVFGCAMRGPADARRQHLTAWYIDSSWVDALRITVPEDQDSPRLAEIRLEMQKIIEKWLKAVDVSWCPIMENRKEIVISRQDKTPAEAFKNLNVAVWGCGALGSHVATFLIQSEVASLHLVDSRIVTPGILGRQLFDDLDIGRGKAEALEARLKKLRPNVAISSVASDLLRALDDLPACLADYDLIIDCTASRAVQLKLERAFNLTDVPRSQMASMVIDARAERAMLLYSPRNSAGSLRDASLRAQIKIFDARPLKEYADTFFPEISPELVQAEPGCSEPTFRGSGADCACLSASMFNSLGRILNEKATESSGTLIRQPHIGTNSSQSNYVALSPITVCSKNSEGLEVRLLADAKATMVNHVQRHKKRRRSHLETGGLLFGQIDEAAGVAWITHATEPPPDSVERREIFICGVKGTAKIAADLKRRYRSAVVFLGMWHTHPDCSALPSVIDLNGMIQSVGAQEGPQTCLLLILSLHGRRASLGTYPFFRRDIQKGSLQIQGNLMEFPLET